MTFRCPKCDSDQTQAIRMVLATGIHRGTAATLGFSQRGGVGLAGSEMGLTSNLAAKYSPGPKPVRFGEILYPILGVGFIFFGLLILAALASVTRQQDDLNQTILLYVFGCSISFLPGGLFFWALITGEKRHAQRLALWEKKKSFADRAWVCLRCGEDWVLELSEAPMDPAQSASQGANVRERPHGDAR